MKKTLLILLIVLLPKSVWAQCDPTTNLAATYLANTTTFTWTAVPNALEYRFEVKYPGEPWVNIIYEDTSATNSISLTGIAQSESFDWRVITICANGNSVPSSDASFTVPCPAPSNLIASQVLHSSATLNWQPSPEMPASLWPQVSIGYRVLGSGQPWTSLGSHTNTNFNLTNLQPNTTYEWCANQNCPYFDSSPVISTFTTLPAPCAAVTLGPVTNLTTTQATLAWSSVTNATNYTLEYKPSTAANWSVLPVGNLFINLSALLPGTTYTYRVLSTCLGGSTNYSSTANFTTVSPPPTGGCNTPTNIYLSSLLANTASFKWAAVANATGYTFEYKPSTASVWVSALTPNVSYTLNNLQTNQTYEFRVRASCNAGQSGFSAVSTFVPQNCVPTANNTGQWIDRVSMGNINRISGADPGGYINTGQSTNLTIGSLNNTITISAATAGAFSNQSFAIYIDYNRNGRYSDAGERVYGVGFLSNANNHNFKFNVPSAATPGMCGLRVVLNKNGVNISNNGCISGFLGEVEDYQVNLVAPQARLGVPEVDLEQPNLVAYPNPSSGSFQLKVPSGIRPISITVLNKGGMVVAQQNPDQNEPILLNLEKEKGEVFYVKIEDQNGKIHSIRLVKNDL